MNTAAAAPPEGSVGVAVVECVANQKEEVLGVAWSSMVPVALPSRPRSGRRVDPRLQCRRDGWLRREGCGTRRRSRRRCRRSPNTRRRARLDTVALGKQWEPERPHILVAACSDGRLQGATDAFGSRALGIQDADRLYTPG